MSVHQCPKCVLRFERRTELDDHCWHDHPEFRHDYPAVVTPPEVPLAPEEHPAALHHEHVSQIGRASCRERVYVLV